jgi:hypothetical protein
MDIQIDTREKKWELARIQRQLAALGARTFLSKLYVGDYLSLDNPRVVIDRKKDLLEICGNVCQQHERFQRELCRARDAGIHIIFLVEHGGGVKALDDVYFWKNPRLKKSPKATTGKNLYKTLKTISERYGVEFKFCDKDETGKKIIELLSGGG